MHVFHVFTRCCRTSPVLCTMNCFKRLWTSVRTTGLRWTFRLWSLTLWGRCTSRSSRCIWQGPAEQGLLLPPYAKHLAEGPAAWTHQSLQGQWGLPYVLRQDGWSCISTCWWSPRRYGLAEGQYTTRRLRTCRLQELCKWELPDDGIPRWLHHHSFHLQWRPPNEQHLWRVEQ